MRWRGHASLSRIPESSFRRRGVGDRLMASLDHVAETHKLAFISLEVRESNLPAIGLYEKNGYHKTGLIPNCYAQPKENAVVMTKNFTERELS